MAVMKPTAKAASHQFPAAPGRPAAFTFAWSDGRTWVLGLLLAAIVFATHANDLGNGFVYDDEENIVKNPDYRGLGPQQLHWMFTTYKMGHYQPLSWVTLGLDYVLWGENPRGYHLTNVLLHTANALLVYVLALALLGARSASATDLRDGRGPRRWRVQMAALLAALFFAVHPLRVESVAWVTERRDVLSSFFLLLATLSYLHAHGAAGVKRPAVWVGLTWVAVACSLLSRAMAVTFPVVLLLLDWYPLRRLGGRSAWRVYAEKIPFLLLSAFFIYIAPVAQGEAGASATLAELSLLERTAQAGYGLVFYLWKTVAPFGLAALYQIPEKIVLLSPKYVVPGILVLLTILALVRWGRRWPWLAVVALLHPVLIGPVLGFLQAGPQEVADRYSYQPAIGWAILAAAGLLWLWEQQRYRRLAPAAVGASVLCLAGLVVLTRQQNAVWHDSISLWEHAARCAPSTTTHQNLGSAYGRVGWLKEAIAEYRAALSFDPTNKPSLNGIAKALTDTGQFDEAARYWELLLRYSPDNSRAHWLYAGVLRTRGQPEQAAHQYVEALRLEPQLTDARLGLAGLLADGGKLDEATAECRRVLEVKPDEPTAHYILGNICATQRRFEEAAAEYRRVLAVNPAFLQAGVNLGNVLERLGRREEAVQAYRAMVDHYPDEHVARSALASALARLGRRDEAIAEYRELLRRNPNDAAARRNLDGLLNPAPGRG
jgi:tetratricopeptide (TPR) repeat protein